MHLINSHVIYINNDEHKLPNKFFLQSSCHRRQRRSFPSDDIWSKFDTKLTTTSIRFRRDENANTFLPCFTICAMPAFRTLGFFYKEKDFIENTYNPEDFFIDETLELLKNNTKYTLTETWSFLYGRCHTICFLYTVEYEIQSLFLKQTWDVKVFIHSKGEEVWLIFGDFPIEKTYLEINTNNSDNITKMFLGITTQEITQFSRENFKCNSYPEVRSFVEPSLQLVWKNLKSQINCSIAMIKQLALEENYPSCTDEFSALKTLDAFNEIVTNLISNIKILPCTRINYILEEEYHHLRTFYDPRRANNTLPKRYHLKSLLCLSSFCLIQRFGCLEKPCGLVNMLEFSSLNGNGFESSHGRDHLT